MTKKTRTIDRNGHHAEIIGAAGKYRLDINNEIYWVAFKTISHATRFFKGWADRH